MCIFVQLNNEERFVGSSSLGGNLSIYPHHLEKNSIFLTAQFSPSQILLFLLRGSRICVPLGVGLRPVTSQVVGYRGVVAEEAPPRRDQGLSGARWTELVTSAALGPIVTKLPQRLLPALGEHCSPPAPSTPVRGQRPGASTAQPHGGDRSPRQGRR